MTTDWINTIGGWVVELAASGAAVLAIRAWFAKPLEGIRTDITAIKADQMCIKDITADLLRDRIIQCHDYHIKRGFCPQSEKIRFSGLYDAYKARGLNHLADQYDEAVISLPEEPARKEEIV